MKPSNEEIEKAEQIITRAICWNCGKSLDGYGTAVLSPKTGRLFCNADCQVEFQSTGSQVVR